MTKWASYEHKQTRQILELLGGVNKIWDYLGLYHKSKLYCHIFTMWLEKYMFVFPIFYSIWAATLEQYIMQTLAGHCGRLWGLSDRSTLPGHVLVVSDILLWLQRRRWWWQNCGGLEVRPTRGGRSLGLCEKVCIKFPFPLIVWQAGSAPHALILKGPRNLCKGCHSHLSAPLNYSSRFWS